MLFQGDATFDNDASYQLLLKVGLGTMAANMELLRLTFFVSEASTSNREVDSDAFGTWAEQLPKTIPMVMSRRVELLPQEDSPWFTGRPSYVAGFNNPLLGEVPAGLPYPEGFPAPGAATCYNFSSYCPTSPHQYVNGPYDSLWYQTELYPFFAVFEGNATLLQEIQSQMLFNPFGTYSLVGVNSFSLTDRFLTNLMNFQLEFSLAPDISGGVVFEEFITACPSSPLRMPLMSLSPVCSVQSGPSFVTCTCESSLPTNHPLLRCDNLRIRVNAGGDLRATITATLRLFATEDWWPGYQPIQWFVQLKSQFGGLSSYRTVRNAGFTVWQDFLMVQTTPELCADECLRRFTTSNPCNSFKYHRVDQDCYLSSYVENTASPLRTDWPGDVFDYYEYQEQVAYALATTEVLVFSGVFFSTLSMEATTFLKPPEPSPPSVDIIQQFFPSYVDQSWLRFRIDLSLVVPIHGQSRWASVEFTPPSGFVAVSLSAMATVPTAMGRGYCSVGRWCRWLLTEGQVLWPGWSYAFELTLKNPPDPARTGQLWTVQVTSPGFVTGPSYSSAAVSVAHPLAIDGWLQGVNAWKLSTFFFREGPHRMLCRFLLLLPLATAQVTLQNASCCPGLVFQDQCNSCVCGASGRKADAACTNRQCEREATGRCHPFAAFPKGDGLNTCTCPADGDQQKAQCTDLKCPKVQLAVTTETAQTGRCCPGYAFMAADGCNTCRCGESGLKNQSACTLMACPPSMLPSERCLPMSTFRASDGFNMCTCPWSGIKAGQHLTSPGRPGILLRGIAEANCSSYACPGDEEPPENGTCCPGLLFTAADGCNTCRCAESGLRNASRCTRMNCPPLQLPPVLQSEGGRFGILMSGNSLSKGLLIVSIINDQNVRKWNEEHCQRQIRVGQIVLKVNGVHDDIDKMLQEFQRSTRVELLISEELTRNQRHVLKVAMKENERRCMVDNLLQHLTKPQTSDCNQVCAICYEEMVEGENCDWTSLPCRHSFHEGCIREWFMSAEKNYHLE
eukprot:symbB.v1.2.022387.t2/scaffold1983.1/size166549/3